MTDDAGLTTAPASAEELEDYVSALFHSSGFYVDKNVKESSPGDDVLELDVFATRYEDTAVQTVLGEAKSGKRWGHPDLFKIVGWMHYLGVPRGAFFVQEAAKANMAAMTQRMQALGVTLFHFADFKEVQKKWTEAGFPPIPDPRRMASWRTVCKLERKLIEAARGARDAAPVTQGPRAVLEYYRVVNDEVFFEEEVAARGLALYNAYVDHPRLNLAVAREMQGKGWDAKATEVKNQLVGEAMFDGKHPLLQATFYVEHRARLALLKAAIDFIYQAEANASPPEALKVRMQLVGLPWSFVQGTLELQKHKHAKKYPLFWQVLLFELGGFLLTDRMEEEKEWLAAVTGVPETDVEEALSAFDILFPVAGKKWVTPVKNNKVAVVPQVPVVFRGVGVASRARRWGIKTSDELRSRYPPTDYTAVSLLSWYKVTRAFLT